MDLLCKILILLDLFVKSLESISYLVLWGCPKYWVL